VIYLVVEVEVDVVDYHVMRYVSVLRKLQLMSNHVLINCVANRKIQHINMLCVCEYVLSDQQVRITKPIRLTKRLETHKTHK
jgi:hypothetical protein